MAAGIRLQSVDRCLENVFKIGYNSIRSNFSHADTNLNSFIRNCYLETFLCLKRLSEALVEFQQEKEDFVFNSFYWDDLAGEEKWEHMKVECDDLFWREIVQDEGWLN